MPDLVKAGLGVFTGAMASAIAAMALLIGPFALQKLVEDGTAGLIYVLAFPAVSVFFFIPIVVLAFVPAMFFHVLAEALGWRHPVAYTVAGGVVGWGLVFLTTALPFSRAADDRMMGYAIASSGFVGGWVFWWHVVLPLRREALSPKSTG